MSNDFTQLRQRLAALDDLQNALQVLHWDQQTMMPPRGGPARAEALATLQRLRHDLFVADETGRLLDAAEDRLDGAEPTSDEASLVRVTRRHWHKARRVPSELAADLARAASVGQEAWVAARANSDFAAFAPYLERNLELARRYVDCLDDWQSPYDALLDDYEPGMTTAEVASLFAELKRELVPVIAMLAAHRDRVDDSFLHGCFPVARQRRLVSDVIGLMGFDPAGWRIDDAVHPFATGVGRADVRITTRWDEHYLPSGLYGAMHECGHGLYEAGIAESLQRTPLGHAESLGLHESQSRMWENMVGRGRPFCELLAPRVTALFEESLPRVTPEDLYRAVNTIKPSHIRVEADEATYSLHIILRFELEQELISGTLAVADLPEAWNARFKEYLGIDVPDDARGVLQDVHWSAGLIGYFPTYVLGNLIAGQLWERVHLDVPGLDDSIRGGELASLREWLRDHVHRHGSKFRAAELLVRAVGAPIAVAPFVTYLKRKLGDVYGIDLTVDV